MKLPALRLRQTVSAPLLLSLIVVPPVAGAEYRTPSDALVAIADAPLTPSALLTPNDDRLLLLERPGLPALEELAREELRLAGRRIRPATSGPSRARYAAGLTQIEIGSGARRVFEGLPERPQISGVDFAPDGVHFAFQHTTDRAVELWLGNLASSTVRRLTERALNEAEPVGISWLPDSSGLIAALVPRDRGAVPEAPEVPAGPRIEESRRRKAPARTYQDLLQGPHDEQLFEYWFSSQLALVTLDGKVTELGEPAILWSFDLSPDGSALLVQRLEPPWSYRVPVSRFPREIELWSVQGESRGDRLRTIASLPLQEEVPMAFGSVATGVRNVSWRPDRPASLVWTEALDGGDARAQADLRDRMMVLDAPFDEPARGVADLALRSGGAQWFADGRAMLRDFWWQTRQTRVLLVDVDGAEPAAPKVLFDRSTEDRYSDPGTPLTSRGPFGRGVLRTLADGRLILVGSGASPDGDRPFLDLYDPASGATERLFRSESPWYERPVDVLESDAEGRPTVLLTRRESVDQPPNYFARHLVSGELRRLTDFEHPTPSLLGMRKELLRYQRADGVELTGTLYTPPGWKSEDGPLPTLMWAYPREFKSAAAAGQVRDSPYRFQRVTYWSPAAFVALGYAVLDDPAMPIIGEGDQEPNDTYVDQLVAGAQAAADELVRKGVAEPGRLAIGGHSYGAFMTANLLAHSDIFAAGIARSGAYNRSLTPFGFQAEQRSFWEAPEIYFGMSPFMNAEKLDEPILLIHGQVDNNSGTFPMQSERFYAAVKGLGGTARLVMLPYESHGYRARPSLLHMLWEQEQWLAEWLAPKVEGTASGGGAD